MRFNPQQIENLIRQEVERALQPYVIVTREEGTPATAQLIDSLILPLSEQVSLTQKYLRLREILSEIRLALLDSNRPLGDRFLDALGCIAKADIPSALDKHIKHRRMVEQDK